MGRKREGPPGRRPLVDDELADQLLGRAQAEGAELLGPDGLLSQVTKAMLERALAEEMTGHLGNEKHDPAGRGSGNSRNGITPKTVLTDVGAVDLAVPRDRNGTFEPQIVRKGQTRLDGFNERIIALYARGMTTRDIRAHLREIYGVEVSPDLISRVTGILAAAGITTDGSLEPAGVPGHVRAQLAPYIAELNRRPVPPFRPVPGLPEQVAACRAADLLTAGDDGGERRFFVHRWTATELAGRAARPPSQRLAAAHRKAAAYWRWRVQVWPQDGAANVHDLLEARHHLLQAGDVEDADQVTDLACVQLHAQGAWDQEASLIHDTLARLPTDSPRQAVWIHNLGIVAQDRGDYDQAAGQYERALEINEQLGNQEGMAAAYYHLGVLAQHRGDYDEAARQYQRALDIFERLGDQAGMADGYGQLGILAQDRGDYDEAARQHQRALDISERLGTRPAWPTATASWATSPAGAGMTTRPPASTSAPSTSSSGSVTRPKWPPSTTILVSSPGGTGTTTRPPASTRAPLTSSSGSATRLAWPTPAARLATWKWTAVGQLLQQSHGT
jgi:tetratricopeptide (TPR) repeat protein